MALTPLPSSIGWGSNPQPSDCEPSALPLDHSFRLIFEESLIYQLVHKLNVATHTLKTKPTGIVMKPDLTLFISFSRPTRRSKQKLITSGNRKSKARSKFQQHLTSSFFPSRFMMIILAHGIEQGWPKCSPCVKFWVYLLAIYI